MIQVVVPTFKRYNNLTNTFNQLKNTPEVKPLFVVHESDLESQLLCKKLKIDFVIDYQPPSGVNATNAGYWATTSDWVVIGQDDFTWHDGWLEEALRVRDETGAKVIGFNDGFVGRNEHSVAWLVEREFVKENSLSIGFPNVIFNPHYVKNFSDNELNDTAKYRKVWAYAENALLEHMHPSFGKSISDMTYEVPDLKLQQDMELYTSRKHLWSL